MEAYNYEKTKKYWDEVYQEAPQFSIDAKLSCRELSEAIQWVSKGKHRILDFGCGLGKALFFAGRCGGKEGIGIDLSSVAIKRAKEATEGTKREKNLNFQVGNINTLNDFENGSFDSVILLNVLDNLHPNDGKKLLDEIYRLLEKDGRLIIKLNPVYEEEVFEADKEFVFVAPSCYEEQSGVLFWNLDEDILTSLLENRFDCVDAYDIPLEDFQTVNRMYCLKKIG